MDEVLAEAFARAAQLDLDLATTMVAGAVTPTEALVTFVGSYAPPSADWTFQLWLDAWSEAARRPALRYTSARLNLAWQELMAGIIRDGVEAGEFLCADPDGAAWRLVSLLDGLTMQVVAHRTTVARETMLEWVLQSAGSELAIDDAQLVRQIGPDEPGHRVRSGPGG